MLGAWASVVGLDGLLDELSEAVTNPKCTSDGRADGISWLATQVCDWEMLLLPHCTATGLCCCAGLDLNQGSQITFSLLQVMLVCEQF